MTVIYKEKNGEERILREVTRIKNVSGELKITKHLPDSLSQVIIDTKIRVVDLVDILD